MLRCRYCGRLHCFWCGQAVVHRPRGGGLPDDATREHVLPRSWDGRDQRRSGWDRMNVERRVELACRACNSARGNEGRAHARAWLPFHEWTPHVERLPEEQRALAERRAESR